MNCHKQINIDSIWPLCAVALQSNHDLCMVFSFITLHMELISGNIKIDLHHSVHSDGTIIYDELLIKCASWLQVCA